MSLAFGDRRWLLATAIGAVSALALVCPPHALSAPPGAAIGAGAANGPSAHSQVLYVLEARRGWARRRSDGHWRLTLRGVSRHVLAFADRPARSSRQLSTKRFVSSWPRIFGSEPPNAAIVAEHGPEGASPTGVDIFKARWEAPGELSVCMCTLGSRSGGWLSALTRASARRHGAIRLFIAGPTRRVPAPGGRGRVQLTYVLQAARGWTSRQRDGEWRLTLPSVYSEALSLSTEPARLAVPIASATLLRSWRRLFGASPPNAALVAAHGPPGLGPVSVELRRPRLLAGGGVSGG
ncbi:MAG: hypothetical protein ACYCU0_12855, partial [Solirubrobacteraceae bacterium]